MDIQLVQDIYFMSLWLLPDAICKEYTTTSFGISIPLRSLPDAICKEYTTFWYWSKRIWTVVTRCRLQGPYNGLLLFYNTRNDAGNFTGRASRRAIKISKSFLSLERLLVQPQGETFSTHWIYFANGYLISGNLVSVMIWKRYSGTHWFMGRVMRYQSANLQRIYNLPILITSAFVGQLIICKRHTINGLCCIQEPEALLNTYHFPFAKNIQPNCYWHE